MIPSPRWPRPQLSAVKTAERPCVAGRGQLDCVDHRMLEERLARQFRSWFALRLKGHDRALSSYSGGLALGPKIGATTRSSLVSPSMSPQRKR